MRRVEDPSPVRRVVERNGLGRTHIRQGAPRRRPEVRCAEQRAGQQAEATGNNGGAGEQGAELVQRDTAFTYERERGPDQQGDRDQRECDDVGVHRETKEGAPATNPRDATWAAVGGHDETAVTGDQVGDRRAHRVVGAPRLHDHRARDDRDHGDRAGGTSAQPREQEVRGNDREQHEDVAPGVVAPEVAERRVRESTGNREAGPCELAITHPEPFGEIPTVFDHCGVQVRIDHVGLAEEPGSQRPEQQERCREQEAAGDDAVPRRDWGRRRRRSRERVRPRLAVIVGPSVIGAGCRGLSAGRRRSAARRPAASRCAAPHRGPNACRTARR